ncbi:hypothetical protein HDU76_011510, partial [Blyttiomyces sp. JEL0837]
SPIKIGLPTLYTSWNNGTGLPDSWAAVISILLATLTYTGYDSAAHLAEETKNPSVQGPRSIAYAMIGTFLSGFFALALLLSTIDPTTYNDLGAQGQGALTTIFINTVGNNWAIVFNAVLMLIAITNIFGLVVTHARQTFAFSRDGALPCSNWLHHLSHSPDGKKAVPIRATWVIVCIDCIILLPSLYSPSLYNAINSFGVIGTYLAYLVPIVLRVVMHRHFPKGPFNLGVFGVPVGIVSSLFLVFASIALILPTSSVGSPDDYEDYPTYMTAYLEAFNWAPLAVFGLTLAFSSFWLISARKWFKGPPLDAETAKTFSKKELEGLRSAIGLEGVQGEIVEIGGGKGERELVASDSDATLE